MDKDNNPFLNQDWLQIQQQYLKILSDLYSPSVSSEKDDGSQEVWNQAIKTWSDSLKDIYSDENRSVIDALVKQSRIFNSITDNFAILLNDMASLGESQDDWQQLLADHFDSMKAMFDDYIASTQDKAVPPGFMWTAPMDSWGQVMARMAILPAEIMEKIQKDGIEVLAQKFLSLPALGMNSEFNEKLQNTLIHWNRYQEYSNRYREVFTRLGKEALDSLQNKIIDKGNKDEKISSLRDLYNMWIDANEEVFAEYAFREEYSTLYSELVNSLIEFRKHSNILSDELLAVLNVPTSAGVKTLTERQHHMKKELRETAKMHQRTLDALDEIRKELKKISATKKSSGKAGKKKIKKTTVQKKTAKKKATGTGSKPAKKTTKSRTRKKS